MHVKPPAPLRLLRERWEERGCGRWRGFFVTAAGTAGCAAETAACPP